MRQEHYQTIRQHVEKLSANAPLAKHLDGYRKAGHSDKRFGWDVFRAAKVNGDSARWLCDHVYPYANDDHVDTAIRMIVREIESGNI